MLQPKNTVPATWNAEILILGISVGPESATHLLEEVKKENMVRVKIILLPELHSTQFFSTFFFKVYSAIVTIPPAKI